MRRHPGRRELAVFAAGYLTYFGVRAVTEGRVDRALANAASVIRVERVLGIAWESAVQSTVAGSRLLRDLANAVYIYGHWPVVILAGMLLYRYRREHYYSLRNACLLTGLLGLFVFALFPWRRRGSPISRSSTRSPGTRRATGRSCPRRW